MEPKVAIITPLYHPSIGGIQVALHCCARYFASQGIRVEVYTTQLKNMDEINYWNRRRVRNFAPEETFENVTIRRSEAGGMIDILLRFLYAVSYHLRLPFWREVEHFYNLRVIRPRKLVRAIRKFAPDVILAAPLTSSVFETALRAKRACGSKLIVKTALHLEIMDPGRSLLHRLADADLF